MDEIQRRRNLVRTFVAQNEGSIFTKKDVWEWVNNYIQCSTVVINKDMDEIGASRIKIDGRTTYALTGTYLNNRQTLGTLHGVVEPEIIKNDLFRLCASTVQQAWRDGRDAILYCDLHGAPKLRLYVLSVYQPYLVYPLTCPHEPTWLRLRFKNADAAEDFLVGHCSGVRVDIL